MKAGIFVIEVKTRTKPHGDAVVQYDGVRVLVNGIAPDRDPIKQVKGGASWMRDFVNDHAALKVRPQGVVLFPGWLVRGSSGGREVWVMSGKELAAWIRNNRQSLTEMEIAHITASLEKANPQYPQRI